jgi:hypothetical protein
LSGIVGVVSGDSSASTLEADVRGLVDAYESLRGPAAHQHELTAGERGRVVVLDSDAANAGHVSDGDSWVAFSGVVYHPRSLLGAPVEELDGQFALVGYEGDEDEIRIASDPFGMLGLYVADRGERTYVSTSALALAKHLRAAPSLRGLHGFLLAGYHFGTLTSWEGIRRLDPATLIRLTQDGTREERYWRPTPDESLRRLGFRETVDRCLEIAVAALREYPSKGPAAWVDLTAGYDSRLLALLLREAGAEIRANTRYVVEGEEDQRIAEQVAEEMGLPWTGFRHSEEWPTVLPSMLRTALVRGDGMIEVLQLARHMWAHDKLLGFSSRLLSGGGGEHYQFQIWKSEFLRAGKSTKVNYDNWLSMRLLPPTDASILAGDPVPETRADFRERMMAWVEPYAHELNTTQLEILYSYRQTGHFGAYVSADASFMRAEMPYYLKPLFMAAFSSNYKHRNADRMIRHMIDRLDPAVAAIATSHGGPAQPWRLRNIHRFIPFFAQLGRKAVDKVATKRRGRALISRGASAYPWAAEADSRVIDLLSADGALDLARMRSGALYDPPAFERFLARARQGTLRADAVLLGRVIAVELAMREADSALA